MTRVKMVHVPQCRCNNPECVRDETVVFAGKMLNNMAEQMMKSGRQYNEGSATASVYLSLVNAFAISIHGHPQLASLLKEFGTDVALVLKNIESNSEPVPMAAFKKPDFVAHGVPFYWSKNEAN